MEGKNHREGLKMVFKCVKFIVYKLNMKRIKVKGLKVRLLLLSVCFYSSLLVDIIISHQTTKSY